MLGYSEKESIVFKITKEDIQVKGEPQEEIDTIICKVKELSRQQYQQLKESIGKFHLKYLQFKYGYKDTYILIGYVNNRVAHIEWIVPAKNINKRYRFVTDNSYAIIGCVTKREFRGKGIFSSQIQKVVDSDVPTQKYWIWAGTSNIPSLKAIHNAGAVEVGKAIRKKWLFGLFSKAELS